MRNTSWAWPSDTWLEHKNCLECARPAPLKLCNQSCRCGIPLLLTIILHLFHQEFDDLYRATSDMATVLASIPDGRRCTVVCLRQYQPVSAIPNFWKPFCLRIRHDTVNGALRICPCGRSRNATCLPMGLDGEAPSFEIRSRCAQVQRIKCRLHLVFCFQSMRLSARLGMSDRLVPFLGA